MLTKVRNRAAARRGAEGLCYVIPAYHPEQTEHFYHLPALLSQIADDIPLAVVVERGEVPTAIHSAREVVAVGPEGLDRVRRAFKFLRLSRRLARLGFRTFFLRYSRLAAMLLLFLRLFYRIRIFYWVSGQAELRTDRNSLLWRVTQLLDHMHLRLLLRSVDIVVTGPETMVSYISRRWRIPLQKIRLLYNEIDTRRFTPAEPQERLNLRIQLGIRGDDFVALFVHRLAARRGVRLLVPIGEAMAGETEGRFRLIVVGTGPDADQLREQVNQSPSTDAFDVKGPIPNRDLPPLYQVADCFLMPSYEEGFPRVILEAMATGTPVVATRAGGTQDVLGADYPYTADPGDIQSLVGHLLELSRDPQLRQRIGKNLRVRAEELYDTRVVAAMLTDLVQHPRDYP